LIDKSQNNKSVDKSQNQFSFRVGPNCRWVITEVTPLLRVFRRSCT